jgi:hypothetical protein
LIRLLAVMAGREALRAWGERAHMAPHSSALPVGLPVYLGVDERRSPNASIHLIRRAARLLAEGLVFGFALFISLASIFTALAFFF